GRGGNALAQGSALWGGEGLGQGMGQGRLYRVVGWDKQTGTHLLLMVPGVEEDTLCDSYLQVVLAEMRYRVLLPDKVEPPSVTVETAETAVSVSMLTGAGCDGPVKEGRDGAAVSGVGKEEREVMTR
ncbi:unnamed protein product, partial [Discosporangium mesarthrocarpum]